MADPAVGYIFGGNTGIPTYQELLRRRAIAAAQAGRTRKMPTTLGEGLTALGESVGDVWADKRLTEAERAFGAAEDERLAVPGRAPSPYASPPAAGGAALPPGVGPEGSVPVAANPARDSLAATLASPAPQEVAQANPTDGAETPRGGPLADPVWSARAHAIGGIESSQDYRAVGVPTKYGRAMGRYGVIEANVPKWTKEALGQALTPEQFLANQQAQDAVFRHRFGQYVAKYGEENAARAWYGGEGNINKPNVMDQHERLTVGTYGQDYLRRLRGRSAEAETEAGSTAPVQLASLGGAAGTMTDAPPPGAGARPMPGVEPEPDPTITEDIKPVSVRTEIAQAPTGVIPGATVVPGGAAGRPAVPADLPPSVTPIPPASEQVMADPGPEPKPPNRLDFSPRQRAWMNVINNRNSSDYAKEYAKNQFDMEEKVRIEMTARQNEAYRDQRERWQQKKDAYDKHVMTADERRIDQLNKRLTAEDQQRKLVVLAPLEEQIKGFERDLKKAEVEGIPDAIAKRKADLNKALIDYGIAVRTLNEPKTLDTAGTRLQAPYDPRSGTYGPYARAPGAPEPKVDLTGDQADAVRFVMRAGEDVHALETKMKHGKVLTDPEQAIKHALPGGNFLVSKEYREAANAQQAFDSGYMKLMSGAAITPSEAALHLPAFRPKPGDDDAELERKSRRRRDFMDAAAKTSGQGGLEIIAKNVKEIGARYAEEQEAKLPPVPVSSPADARAREAAGELKPGRRLLLPDGSIKPVPRR